MALYRRNQPRLDPVYEALAQMDVDAGQAQQEPAIQPLDQEELDAYAESRANPSQTERAFNQGVAGIKSSGYAVRGLARGLVGDEEGARRDIGQSIDITERAAARGPDIQDLSDINGVGDALAYARNLGVGQLPNIALTVGTGGAGGLARLGGGRAATIAAERVARRTLLRDATEKYVGSTARRFAQGSAIGGAVGGSALQAGQTAPGVLDPEGEGSIQERSGKALLGAVATGSLEALPVTALLRRYGLAGAEKAAQEAVTGPLLARLAKQGAKQGLTEGATELAQTVGEVATHKWINDNVDLVGPDALNQYVNAAVGGAVGGSIFGAPAGIRGGVPTEQQPGVRERVSGAVRRFTDKLGPPPDAAAPPVAPTPVEGPDGGGVSVAARKAFNDAKAIYDEAFAPGGQIENLKTRMGAKADDIRSRFAEQMKRLKDDGWFENSLDQEFAADPFDFSDVNGTGVVGGAPMKGFIDQTRFAENKAAGLDDVAARWASPIDDPATVAAMEEQGVFNTVNRAFRGDDVGSFSTNEKQQLRDYLGVLDDDQANRFRRWLSTADEMAERGLLERDDKGVVRSAQVSVTRPPAEGVDAEVDAARALDNPDLTKSVARAGRGGVLRPGVTPSEAWVGTDAAGNRRSINLASMLKTLDADKDLQELTKGMSAEDRQVSKVTTALAMLADQGITVDPTSIRAIRLDRDGNRFITQRQAQRIASGLTERAGDPTGLTTAEVRRANPGLRRAIDDAQGQADPAEIEGVTGREGQPDEPPRGPVQAGTGSPQLAEMTGREQDSGRIDKAAQERDKQANRTDVDALLERYTGTKPRDFEHRRQLMREVLNEGRRDFTNVKSQINERTGQLERRGKPVRKKLGPNEREALIAAGEEFAEKQYEVARTREREAFAAWQKNKTPETKKALDKARRSLEKAEELSDRAVARSEKKRDARNPNPLTKTPTTKKEKVRAAVREAPENVRVGLDELTSLLTNDDIYNNLSRPEQLAKYTAAIDVLAQTEPGRRKLIESIFEIRSRNALDAMGARLQAMSGRPNMDAVFSAWLERVGNYGNTGRDLAGEINTAAREEVARRAFEGENTTTQEQVDNFYRAVSGAKTVEAALRNARPLASPQQQRIIDALIKTGALKGSGFEVDTRPESAHTGGQHFQGTVTLYRPGVPNNEATDPVGVLVHEAVHAATTSAERKSPKAQRELGQLLKHARAEAQKRGLNPEHWYGLSETQEFLAEAFSNPAFQAQLKEMPAYGTDTFNSLWDQFKDWVARLLGLSSKDASLLDEIITVGIDLAVQQGADRREAMGTIFSGAQDSAHNQAPASYVSQLEPRERAYLISVFQRPDIARKIVAQLPKPMRAAALSADRGPYILLDAGVAQVLNGQLKLDQTGPVNKLWNTISKSLQIPSKEVYAKQILADLKAGNVTNSYDVRAQVLRPAALKATRLIEKHVEPVWTSLANGIDSRMRDTGVPALTELATLLSQRTGETRANQEKSYRFRVSTERDQRLNELEKIVGDLTPQQERVLVRSLQRANRQLPKKYASLQPKADALGEYLDDMFVYMTEAGLELGNTENYYPVTIDPERITRSEDQFRKLLSAPNFAKSVAKAGGIDALVDAAKRSTEQQVGNVTFAEGDHDPTFKPLNERLSAFIYKEGTPEQIREFTQFQSPHLVRDMISYTARAVRRAEWSRMKLGPRIKELLEKAKTQGATDQQQTMAKDYVDQIMGSYNNDWNPVIKRILESIDRVFGTNVATTDFEKFKSVQQALIAYQNIRLLGLSALSSVIDPLGTAIRSGTMKGAFSNMRDALRAYRDANGNDDLRAMAEDLGVIERSGISEGLAYMYGSVGDPNSLAQRANTLLFRYNGLEAVTRFTRLTALAAAHRFIIRHANSNTEESQRYMRELGLKPSDVQVVNNHVVLNDKTSEALRRFVDESVVRPKPENRPSWHNDPNFQLAAQYKGYLYAFYETVLLRAQHELKNGNYAVLAPLMMYLPITAAAEMLRDGLQGDDDDRDMYDYAKLSLDRSGLLGARVGIAGDVNRNFGFGGSGVAGTVAGPTGQQLADAYDVLTGDKTFGSAAIESLPGHTLFEDWQL